MGIFIFYDLALFNILGYVDVNITVVRILIKIIV